MFVSRSINLHLVLTPSLPFHSSSLKQPMPVNFLPLARFCKAVMVSEGYSSLPDALTVTHIGGGSSPFGSLPNG